MIRQVAPTSLSIRKIDTPTYRVSQKRLPLCFLLVCSFLFPIDSIKSTGKIFSKKQGLEAGATNSGLFVGAKISEQSEPEP